MDTIHIAVAQKNTNTRTTKTGCGILQENLGRKAGVVEFRNRHISNCPDCIAWAEKIAKLHK